MKLRYEIKINLITLQIPVSHYEKKNAQNEPIIYHFFSIFLLVTIVRLFGSL